jgi:hypothetical protein
MQEKQNVSSNTVSTTDPEEPSRQPSQVLDEKLNLLQLGQSLGQLGLKQMQKQHSLGILSEI